MSETGIIPPPRMIPKIETADIMNEEFLPIIINIQTESVDKKSDVTMMDIESKCISASEKYLLDKKKSIVIKTLNKKIYMRKNDII